ncbi:hypothetical protein [Mariniblastus fucicola]|uniref:hypothetical protein n=1 Tax=Mariniblastus fucicola TaxID=980251 RepID=UPI0011DF65D6|nr:hypothetical protein [Mariniblastus fucicola]
MNNQTKMRSAVSWLFVAAMLLSATVVTGCGPSDPDESTMDRVPNVPPSTRGKEGGESRIPSAPKANR